MRRRTSASTRRRGRSCTAAWSRRCWTPRWAAPAGRRWATTSTSSPRTCGSSSCAPRGRARSGPTGGSCSATAVSRSAAPSSTKPRERCWRRQGSPRSSAPIEARQQARLHRGPLVVDHGVPGRVAALAAADEHVLAEDTLELSRQRRECRPRPVVARIRLELDPEVALVLERVLHQEQLRLGVRAGPPRLRREPRVADLEHTVVVADVQVAGVPKRAAVDERREAERGLLHAAEPHREGATACVAADAHPPPGPLVLGDLPEHVLVPRLERLEPHVAAVEGYVKRQVPPSWNERRMRRATTIRCTSSAPS